MRMCIRFGLNKHKSLVEYGPEDGNGLDISLKILYVSWTIIILGLISKEIQIYIRFVKGENWETIILMLRHQDVTILS